LTEQSYPYIKCILFVKDYPRIFIKISDLNDSDVQEISIFEINLFGQNGKQLYKNVPLLDFLSFCNSWCGSKIQHVCHGKFISKIDIS
jgi:hypothetical protein